MYEQDPNSNLSFQEYVNNYFKNKNIQFPLMPYQKELLNLLNNNKKVMILRSRSCGIKKLYMRFLKDNNSIKKEKISRRIPKPPILFIDECSFIDNNHSISKYLKQWFNSTEKSKYE